MFRFKTLVTEFPIIGWVNKKLDRRFTLAGKCLLIFTLFCALGSTHVDTPVYLLCGAGISVLFSAWMLSWYFRPNMKVGIDPVEIVTANEPFLVGVKLVNQSANNIYWIEVRSFLETAMGIQSVHGDQDKWIPLIEPGHSQYSSVEFVALRRGVHSIPDLAVATDFPFRLIRQSQRASTKRQVCVLPPFHPLDSLDFVAKYLSKSNGDLGRSMTAGEMEFVASREFVPGLPTRRLDHRAWARLGKPHVRRFEDQGLRQCSIILDTSMDKGGEIPFEASISLAATLVEELHQQMFEFEFASIGSQLIDLSHDTRFAQFKKIAWELANANPSDNVTFPEFSDLLSSHQLVVLITTCDGDAQRDFVQKWKSNGSHLLALLVQNETSESWVDDGPWINVSVEAIRMGNVSL